MNEATAILKNAEEKIKTLIAENRWLEGHRACLEVLRFDPDNISVIRLKNKIEKIVRKKNIKAIKEDLKTLKPLFKEGKYEELLSHLKQLEPYITEYKPLEKFIIKAQSAYKKSIRVQQIKFFGDELKVIQEMIKQERFQEALLRAEKLRILNVNKKEIAQLVIDIKTKWIDAELAKKSEFLKTEKYEDILIFLIGLKKISGKSEKLNSLVDKFNKKNEIKKLEQRRDAIFTGTEKIKTLLQLKKFDIAIQVAEEILDLDPSNAQIRAMLIKASKKEMKRVNKQLVIQMKASYKKLKASRKNSPEDFIKI